MLAFFLGVLLTSAQGLGSPTEAYIHPSCDGRADCIVMALDLDEEKAGSIPIKVVPGKGSRRFYMTVKGRLPGESRLRPLVLILRASPESEGECSRFGDAVAAVLGFATSGNPILLTDAGEVEISEEALIVGCRDCLRLLDPVTKTAVYKATTPSWDLWSIGYKQEEFRYNDRGEVYLARGDRCLKISGKERFKLSPKDRCSTSIQEIGNYGRQPKGTGMILQPAEWLYRSRTSRLLMFLEAGACT
jgi:hypothetical protein